MSKKGLHICAKKKRIENHFEMGEMVCIVQKRDVFKKQVRVVLAEWP